MTELGSKLKEARIEQGYTLNTLQQITKIQKKYLEAIEEGNYELVPGNFYIRAFVKQYADAVGLNGDQLVADYHNELEVFEEESIKEEPVDDLPSRSNRSQNEESDWVDQLAKRLPLIGLVAAILLIMVMIIITIQRSAQYEPTSVSNHSSAQSVVSSVEPNSVASSRESKQEESTEDESEETAELGPNDLQVGRSTITRISDEGEEVTYVLNDPIEDYKITVKGLGFVWVGYYEDEMIQLDTSLTEDETVEIDVNPEATHLRLRVGYPEGATIYLNDVEVPIDDPYFNDTIVFEVKTTDDEPLANEEVIHPAQEATLDEVEDEEAEGYQGPAVLDPDLDWEESAEEES